MKDIESVAAPFNDGSPEDIDYEIARYVLTHLREVDAESMGKIAQGALVSKSTLSRFVRRLGFEDYDDFLVAVREVTRTDFPMIMGMTPGQVAEIRSDPREFLGDYVRSICDTLTRMAESLSMDDAVDFLRMVLSRPTTLIAQDEPLLVAREFQYHLLCEGVLACVPGTERRRLECLGAAGEGDVVVVLSNYGGYVNTHEEELKAAKARGAEVWLVTLCHSAPNLLIFDRVITLSDGGYSRAGAHPMRVYFEFLERLMHLGGIELR